MSWSGTGIGSYRYGPSALWTLSGNLSGSGAGRLVDRVDLFFRAGESALILDVRQVGLIDSLGAAALARCRAAHDGLRIVGRPPTWHDLPLPVRLDLLALDAAPDLETALAATTREAARLAVERRRHQRIPVQIPIEMFFAGRRVQAALSDISRGGVHLSLIPGDCLETLRAADTIEVLGLAADPLAGEITARFADEPIPLAAVHAAAGAAIGARFADTSPPG